jgi:arylsulfatase
VNDKDYTVPFPFDGRINKLTFNLGPSQLSPVEEKSKQEGVAKAKD